MVALCDQTLPEYVLMTLRWHPAVGADVDLIEREAPLAGGRAYAPLRLGIEPAQVERVRCSVGGGIQSRHGMHLPRENPSAVYAS
jgi:hypothetical protein